VFFITGLWHGASLNFIFWGLGHGLLLFGEKIFGKKIGNILKDGIVKDIVSHVYVLTSVVLLWTLFRLDIKSAYGFIKNLFSLKKNIAAQNITLSMFVDTRFYIFFIIGIIGSFPWRKPLARAYSNKKILQFMPIIKHGFSLILFAWSICSLASNAYNPFIYFRF
jgi:uncharacterized membrane protein